jgi:hypothetical protein
VRVAEFHLMKIRWEVDLTPEEAREALGLPDVKPMQAAVLAKMEKKLTDAIDTFGPETIIQSWFATIPQGADAMRNLFTGFLNLAGSKKGGSE